MQMDPRGPHEAWELQMAPVRSKSRLGGFKWSLGGQHGASGVQMELGGFQIGPWTLLLIRILHSNDHSGAPAHGF